ncbi:MAG TPA: MarR family winged helix-turn-helix transcriptional regulator [Chitinophagaceae bacterium]|nr:MarR family winged helix-turn-helix transcriptional regulator [Chitinophagaceae bacterium]
MEKGMPLTAVMARTSRLYRIRLNQKLSDHNIDLSSEMCGTLLELGKKEGRHQKELATTLFKDKGGITKLLKSLSKRAFIFAKADEIDKRHKKIYLTEKGHQVLKKAMPLVEEVRAQTLNGLDNVEIIQTREVLEKVISNLIE